MRAKHTFNPEMFDRLESREVLSALHPHLPPHSVVTAAARAQAIIAELKALHVSIPMHVLPPTTPSPRPVTTPTTITTLARVTTPTNLTPVTTPTTAAQATPMANVTSDLKAVFSAFQGGSTTPTLTTQFPMLRFQGNSVGVNIKASNGNFAAMVTALTNLGMTINTQSAAFGLVEGFLPINQLPTASALPAVASIVPNFKPMMA
jgi:hypothetical protein